MRRSWQIITLAALVLAACTPTPEPGQSPAGTPDAASSPPSQPAASASPLSAWKLLDPSDSDLPTIVEQAEQGYRIRSDWQIASIKYRYHWIGLGDETNGHQDLLRTEQGFERDGVAVAAEDVQAFVQALDHLYPVQSALIGQSHTDDYPEWNIAVAGADDVQVLISSSSTGNPGGGPWNVVVNGQRFAQYNAALVNPLAQLFKDTRGIDRLLQPDDMLDYNDGRARFGTAGFPLASYQWNTRAEGVELDFKADPQAQAISGNLLVDPNVLTTPLKSIELKLPDESTVICTLADNERNKEVLYFTAWGFHCPVAEVVSGLDYTYALFLVFANQPPAIIRLVGTWGQPFDAILHPPPLEFTSATAGHAVIQDLLTDHTLLYLNYSAELKPNEPSKANLIGDALLIGQVGVNNQTVRYSVESPFIISDGGLTRWDLDRASLIALRDEVLALELTKRVLAADPLTIINLRYIGKPMGEVPYSPMGMNDLAAWELEVLPCGAIPGGRFPTAEQALRGFSYNPTFKTWAWRRSTEFVLINGQPVVAELDLAGPPDQHHKGASQQALIPEGLDTGSRPPFDRIWQTTSSFWGQAPILRINLPDSANLADPASYDRASYERQIDALKLPFTDGTYGDGWEASNVTIGVGPDGVLRLVQCP